MNSDSLQPGRADSRFADLLPDSDYEFPMRFQRGRPADFFGPSGVQQEILAERRRWLREEPSRYAALLPEGQPLLEEMLEVLRADGLAVPLPERAEAEIGWPALLTTGEALDPDFLLLKHTDVDGPRLVAGCVCFPSAWSLAEKVGRPVDWIHSVVPGLNDALGARIGTFLRRMAPGRAWLRANWGLSRSAELNQHPERGLPRLDASVAGDEVWFRIERQALVALPKSGGFLFGIRIAVHSLAEVKADPVGRTGLRRALRTMPEPMAVYKGVATVRERLLALLDD